MKIWLLLIASLGLYLSVANQSLWLDEAISVNVVKNNSYGGIVSNFSKYDFHPPVYYLILKTWTSIFGYSEVAARMPSIIFCLVTIYVVYLMAGVNAAMLVAFNPLLIYYSHEARMYSLVTMVMTLAIYFLVKKKYLWTGVMCGLGFTIFYGSVFMSAAIGIYLLLNKKYREAIMFGLGPMLAILLMWPLLKEQIKHSAEMLTMVSNWSLVLGKVNIKNMLLIPMKFTSGRISFYPKIVYYLIAGGWSILVFSKLFKKNIYSYLFWTTLGIGVIFSMFTPMLQYFRFVYLIPLMGLAIKENKYISIGFLIWGLIYIANLSFHREDWKSLSRDLPEKVYMIDSFADPVKYYKTDIQISDIRSPIVEKNITVISYGETIHGVDHVKILTEKGYKLVETKSYRELTKEIWQHGT
ncbi:MAG: glycosyltransferase family 39 protein [Microgenomates group bacterium]